MARFLTKDFGSLGEVLGSIWGCVSEGFGKFFGGFVEGKTITGHK